MSWSSETLINKTAQIARNVLFGVGFLAAVAAVVGYKTGGAVFVPALISIGAFFIAIKIKVVLKKQFEISGYR